MNKPEQEQIDHWLKVTTNHIKKDWELYHEGFYEKENISIQSVYAGFALDNSSLARAKFLNGDPIKDVRNQFAQAAKYMMKSFTMAYDPSDSDYQGESTDWSCVSETNAIEGMDYALMSGDFDLASKLASLFQNRLDGYTMAIEVNRYAHTLANVLTNKKEGAMKWLNHQMADYKKKPAQKGYRLNYYTLSLALEGILEFDEKKFNQGLLEHLEFYQNDAQGELKDTDEEFICDDAVALANLGIKHGLAVTVEYDTLPKGLLINS
ncbi:MAG: immunity 49 family protein [Proteobacteria bacterium]|nr:immunity 49 family protein [Pseudomonadota bacterium]